MQRWRWYLSDFGNFWFYQLTHGTYQLTYATKIRSHSPAALGCPHPPVLTIDSSITTRSNAEQYKALHQGRAHLVLLDRLAACLEVDTKIEDWQSPLPTTSNNHILLHRARTLAPTKHPERYASIIECRSTSDYADNERLDAWIPLAFGVSGNRQDSSFCPGGSQDTTLPTCCPLKSVNSSSVVLAIPRRVSGCHGFAWPAFERYCLGSNGNEHLLWGSNWAPKQRQKSMGFHGPYLWPWSAVHRWKTSSSKTWSFRVQCSSEYGACLPVSWPTKQAFLQQKFA